MFNSWPQSESLSGHAMLLPGQPEDKRLIRYMIRTEPGARKAVMAGLEDLLLKADEGRIIVVSTGGLKMLMTGNALYLGSKGALHQFVRTFAQELGPRRITVNSLLPGYTDTDLLPERDRKVAAGASPFKRVGAPEDVADAAAFLASNDARWVTGQELGAGGGVF